MPIVGPFLTAQQIEAVWTGAGGAAATAAAAAAVAIAESSGGTHSYHVNTNGTTDYGLWQINSSDGGSSALFDPDYGASIAIRLSSGGTDWRQWCTAYTDAACGTNGGTYAPFGASPVGTAYTTIVGAAAARAHVYHAGPRVETRAHPASDLAGRDVTFPEAFHHLMHAVGVTIPTRVKWADYANRRMRRAVR